ncbi:MAG: GspE/PulE family protein [bacterium]
MASKPLGELLIEAAVVTPAQLQVALKEQSKTGKLLGEILERLAFATRIEIVRALATQGGVPYVELRRCLFEPQTLDLFNPSNLKALRAIPLWVTDTTLSAAISDPSNTVILDRLRETAKRDIFVYGADEKDILHFLEFFYGDVPAPGDGEALEFAKKRTPSELSPTERTAFRVFHQVLTDAVRIKASAIHIEPDGAVLRIRYRTESGMAQGPILLYTYQAYLMNYLKSFLQMGTDGASPQEGSAKALYLNREFDIKASILPTVQGEMAAIRMIEKESALLSVDKLGFSENHLQEVQDAVKQGAGVILVVGPPFSGRTTTLYALTLEANSIDKTVATMEDSVDIQLAHINQISLDDRAGLRHPGVLQYLVRQHMDVIMIADLRERESVELAMQAASQSTLVIAGYSASDASDALHRWISMGMDPYYIGVSVSMIIAQRLARMICRECRESYVVSRQEVPGLEPSGAHDVTLFRGRGCPRCGGTGYLGHVGIFEVFCMTDEIRRALNKTITQEKLRKLILEHGGPSLAQDGLTKALRGMITLEEVQRVLR